mmetsp:Transcript_59328/g.193516  ORF Transcript_59328/g.193516 Transcript_59328/m.193516 type:complete len:322 (-) Transcript_59328:2439-3404(-)
MEHRLQSTHHHQQEHQQEASAISGVPQVARDLQTPKARHGVPLSVRPHAELRVLEDEADHRHKIHQQPSSEDQEPHVQLIRTVRLREDCLAKHEEHQADHEPNLRVDELSENEPVPHRVGHKHDHLVRHVAWVLGSDEPAESFRDAIIFGIDEQVLDVVIHAPISSTRDSGAPNQTLHDHGQQCRGISDKPLDDIVVPAEEVLHTVVVTLAVSTDDKQVLYDRLGGLQAAALDGPHQRRDVLRAGLHLEQPIRARGARCTGQRTLELRHRVGVDGLHHDGGAFVDCSHQHLRDQPEGPAEGLQRQGLLTAVLGDHLHVDRD